MQKELMYKNLNDISPIDDGWRIYASVNEDIICSKIGLLSVRQVNTGIMLIGSLIKNELWIKA